MIDLRPLRLLDMPPIVDWRNGAMETLRTPYYTTLEMQEEWYYKEIANRESHTRYWGLWLKDSFMGYGGIEHIEWENSRGEISLLIAPQFRHKGCGRKAVELFLDQAFNYINLATVWGEVYHCGHPAFWEMLIRTYNGFSVDIPKTKYYAGKYYPATYFTFYKEAFNEVYNPCS